MKNKPKYSEAELLDRVFENKQQRIDILCRKLHCDIYNIVDEIQENQNRKNVNNWKIKLPKWIRKQTRKLKSEAKKIKDKIPDILGKFRIMQKSWDWEVEFGYI